MDSISALAKEFDLTWDEATKLFREGELWIMDVKKINENFKVSVRYIFKSGCEGLNFVESKKEFTGA